jgi:hypothetical protein
MAVLLLSLAFSAGAGRGRRASGHRGLGQQDWPAGAAAGDGRLDARRAARMSARVIPHYRIGRRA